MTPTMALSLALAVPETPENYRVLRELISAIQALINKEEDSSDD